MPTTARSTYDAFRQSMLAKTDNWQDLLSEDATLSGPLATVAGKDAFIAVNAPFFAGIQDSRLLEIIEADDRILTRIETDVTTPAGETLTLEVAEWYLFKDGKLVALKVYFDTAAFREVFGM